MDKMNLLVRKQVFPYDVSSCKVLEKNRVSAKFATTIFNATQGCRQCWNVVGTIRNNVATMLQSCVALKIVVANRLV